MLKRFFSDRLVHRTGGWSLIIIMAVAQVISLLGAIPGFVSIRVNAEFDSQQLQAFATRLPLLILLANLLLLGAGWQITTVARKRLNEWAAGQTKPKQDDEFLAWREVTSLTWRYGI